MHMLDRFLTLVALLMDGASTGDRSDALVLALLTLGCVWAVYGALWGTYSLLYVALGYVSEVTRPMRYRRARARYYAMRKARYARR